MSIECQAHVGDIIAGIDVIEPRGDESRPPIQATYGLLVQQTDGYRWVCHEAITEPKAIRAPRYVRNTDGIWLATLSDLKQGRNGATLFRSPDGGCSWNDVSGIPAGVQIAEVAFHPDAPTLAIAASNTPSEANGVFLSTDGGDTWSAPFKAPVDRYFHSVGYVQGLGFATATNHAGDTAYIWLADKAGVWTEQTLDLATQPDTRFAVLTVDGPNLWAVIDPIGNDSLGLSTDGGETWSIVTDQLEQINDAAVVGGKLWVTRNNGLDISEVAADGTVTPGPDGFLASFGIQSQGDDVWFAPLSFVEDALLVDGPPLQVQAYPDDIIEPLDCPPGTEAAEICEPLWPTLEPRLRGFDTPTVPIDTADTGTPTDDPPPEEPSGCAGCSSGGGSAAGMSLTLLFGLFAFRRRS